VAVTNVNGVLACEYALGKGACRRKNNVVVREVVVLGRGGHEREVPLVLASAKRKAL